LPSESPKWLSTLPSPPYAIGSADLNGDGKPDLVTANSSSNSMTILLNKGTGTFATSTYTLTSSNGSPIGPRGLALADLNGDGKIDIAAANSSGSASVSLGNGDGTFQAAAFYPTGTSSTAVAAGDLNGDGKPDLVVANMGDLNDGGSDSGSVSILLGSGAGDSDGDHNQQERDYADCHDSNWQCFSGAVRIEWGGTGGGVGAADRFRSATESAASVRDIEQSSGGGAVECHGCEYDAVSGDVRHRDPRREEGDSYRRRRECTCIVRFRCRDMQARIR
jgi:hypothetical protein